jgi:uncharacterized protein (TIGR03118 family)
MRSTHLLTALALTAVPFVAQAAPPEPAQQYTVTNLVSDLSGTAAVTDPNLVNPWGLSRSSGSPWWVADNGTGLSTLYKGDGTIIPLVVTIPPSDPTASPTGTPTGTVFNGTKDFRVGEGPAIFLFATEDGTISGWNGGTHAVLAVNEGTASVFKGLTMGQAGLHQGPLANYLYAANFRSGHVAVFDKAFHHVPAIEAAFDSFKATGYAPFNVQNIGGDIYVAYAVQDSAKHDEVDGEGLGKVVVFHTDGTMVHQLQSGPWFNAPWGLTGTPSDFGFYSHDVLVGNFGSGHILAFDPITGTFKGTLRDSTNTPLWIDGLWGISFANGATAGSATTLYFAAGTNHEQDGTLGSIAPIQNSYGNDY